VQATLICEPSHAHPGEKARQTAPGDAKQTPVAAQPAASGYPQRLLFGQSPSVTQEREPDPLDEEPEPVVPPEVATPDPPPEVATPDPPLLTALPLEVLPLDGLPLNVPPVEALPLEALPLEADPEPPSSAAM
jgi:hypothetical protein